MLLLCLLGRPSKPVHSRLCLEIVAHFFLKTVLFFGCFCCFTLGFGGLFKNAMGFSSVHVFLSRFGVSDSGRPRSALLLRSHSTSFPVIWNLQREPVSV